MNNDEISLNSHAGKRLRVGDLEIDVASGTLWRAGRIVDLPELSFRLLVALVDRAPELVSKDDLIRAVWGEVVVSDETLAQRARLLRQALGDDGSDSRYFTAVRGRGYRLTAPVETVRPEAPAAAPASQPDRSNGAWLAFAAALILGAIVFWRADGDSERIDRLAVLPFQDMSREGGYSFFADGMQEELLARLARIGEIDVLSRTSVERFRDTDSGVPEIAEALGVDAVIEGSVRVTGDDLRITVQLIDGASDRHLWVETYDRVLSIENIFEIQRRVADEIAAALRLDRDRSGEVALPTASLEAYNRYLLGRYHTSRLTPESLDAAVENLESAVAIDPQFAEAHVGLGWALAFQGTNYGTRRPREVYPLARESALRALELDDTLAEARSLYAGILTWYDWEFELAESEHRRAIALNPLNVLSYALLLSTQARHDEAIELVERLLDSAPEDPYVQINAAWRYLNAGRYDDAIRMARAAETHPDAGSVLGHALLRSGATDEAIAVFEDDIARHGRRPTQVANLAHAYYRAGRRSDGDALLDELEERAAHTYLPAILLAALNVEAGNNDEGYRQLTEAVDNRERGVIFLALNPVLGRLAEDPRYAERVSELLEQIGLPSQ